MVTLVYWIVGADILEQINDRFLLMNNIALSFAMLSSVEIVRELIDLEFLSVDTMISRSTVWKSKLFCELVVGFYWAQIDLRDSV